MNIIRIRSGFAICGALAATGPAAAARLGFKSIISLRPDDEEAGQMSAADLGRLAQDAGLAFAHVPARKSELFTEPVVSGLRAALARSDMPVLAMCASGQRAAIVWAAASARSRPVDEILADLAAAGLELEFLRDDLESQADRARWLVHSGAPLAGARA